MKKKLTTLSLLVFVSCSLFAQIATDMVKPDESKIIGTATKSAIHTATGISIQPVTTDLKWRPILTNKCIFREPKVPFEEYIESLKNTKTKIVNPNAAEATNKSVATVVPVVGVNYLGNENNGSSPMDNNVAISNGGWIVSVANNTIEYDNMSGSTIYYNDIVSFIGDASISNVCDPVVLYDKLADRFIFFAQECSGSSSNSHLLIFFSKTNDPNAGWWYYKLNGNPLSDGSWFDYPKIAISNNELYISGNLFYDSGTFNQAVLYQIQKSTAYSGGVINWQYWTGISGNPFTLLPVSNGHGLSYGPGCYMVATDNFGSSNIKLYHLTDDMSGSPAFNQYNVPTTAYSPTGYNAAQLGTSIELKFFDSRAMSGFFLNGLIHFVFHSDVGGAWYGINYNRLNVAALTNQSSMFGASGAYDYGYPSVVSFGTSVTDKSVMIGYGRSGSSIYPEVRVVNCDNMMNWSTSTLVKSSASFVSYTGNPERWGDYTGTTRKHNSPTASIWMNGMYGTSLNVWSTWVAEIHAGAASDVAETTTDKNVNVFPNPVTESFTVAFTLEESTMVDIAVMDLNGKLVQSLYNGKATAGSNTFSFNKANLAKGTYFLMIKDNTKIIKNEKIIIAN